MSDTRINAPIYEFADHYFEQPFNGKIVFTNGCFDLLHAGHISYLQESKKHGDYLILGLNSDASVRRLKGKDRPVHSWRDRAIVLAALRCVDAIIKFDEDTPLKLIKRIKPDVITKGGDYHQDQMIGKAFVASYGGQALILSYHEGHSSSALIKKSQ